MNERDVFINCPFSPDYQIHFDAPIYTILRAGFIPRCARENDDGGEVRIDKICRIISESRFGVHDISMTELDEESGLPRFNMPLELGLFLGARKFGGRKQSAKKTLIFDREPYRYQTFISDIAGQDVHCHNGDVGQLVRELAGWLRDEARDEDVPGGGVIAAEFERYRIDLPEVAAARRLEPAGLTFRDRTAIAATWILAVKGAR